MDAGRSTVEWLYKEQLQVDEGWSVRRSDGFTWWPYRHAQHVDVIGSEVGPDGNAGYFVRSVSMLSIFFSILPVVKFCRR